VQGAGHRSLLDFRVMPPTPLVPIEEMLTRLDRALAHSPAEETEIVWIEARRGQESNGKRRRDSFENMERTLLIRVRESGRTGLHRMSAAGLSDLENAVREALGQARLAPLTPPPLQPPGAAGPLLATPEMPGLADPLFDAEVARLVPGRARDLIQRQADRGEVAWIGWGEGQLAVVNSRGLRRAAAATTVWTVVSCGNAPGAGRAMAAARSLDGLDLAALFERARQRHAGPGNAANAANTADIPQEPVPLVLSPDAAAALVDLLNRYALGSATFRSGPFRGRIGEPVCHPAITLRDDPAKGLPFPFDFFGAAKHPVDLIDRGVLVTPAIDGALAAETGLPPTPHQVAADEALAAHLTLQPGDEADEDVLRRADGGIWVSALDEIQAFDPGALRFRARARGVRRIEGGTLGAAFPDLLWEDSLPDLLARVLGVGRTMVSVTTGDPLLGATTSPLLAFETVSGLRTAQRSTPRS
jgi:predicted Zn-dependent protease